MSKRYIDVDAAVSNAEARYGEWVLAMAAAEGNRQISMVYKKQELFKAVKKVIESCPSVDPESLRPTAKWIIVRRMADGAECKCGNCGRKEVFTTFDRHTEHAYCCRCGCKMEAAVGIEVRKNDDYAV